MCVRFYFISCNQNENILLIKYNVFSFKAFLRRQLIIWKSLNSLTTN